VTDDAPLAHVVDELVVAVDRLFVAELRLGTADEETVELVAKAHDLARASSAESPCTR
jgi:hypothetical protein